MIQAHPWGIGCGGEAFAAIYPAYAVSGTESAVHTHRLWLQITAELGIQGALAFLMLLLLCGLSFCIAIHNERGKARGELLAVLCGLIGVLIMGLFDYVWYHCGMIALFFALCSAGSVYQEEKKE